MLISRRLTRSSILYADNIRTSTVQYEEAYGIVHLRDAEGKYVIRHPILREHEPSRTLYEDGHHRHTGQGTHPLIYDTINASAAARQGRPGPQPASLRMREASITPPRIMDDSSCYEEDDPRNPAPVPTPSAARDSSHGCST
ncbi:hypothetical protein CGRA01v4_04895 [Colletotrichum graminicola]|nr:hypothetical protein CGRA01v4_04895 [Colletotrichum graminicola]